MKNRRKFVGKSLYVQATQSESDEMLESEAGKDLGDLGVYVDVSSYLDSDMEHKLIDSLLENSGDISAIVLTS